MQSTVLQRALGALLVAAAAFAVYFANLDDYFIADDFDLIQSFQDQPPVYFVKLLAHSETNWFWDPNHESGMLRPIKIWLLKLDQELWGTESAAGFHLTGTLFFAAVTAMVFLIFGQLFPGRPEMAILAGLLTALHPVFSEIVPVVTFREESISTAFGLASFLLFLRFRTARASPVGFYVLYSMGLLTKESGIVYLALPFGFDAIQALFSGAFRVEARRRLIFYAPVVAILVGYFILRAIAFGVSMGLGTTGALYSDPLQFLAFHARFAFFLAHPNMLASPVSGFAAWIFALIPIAVGVLLYRGRAELGRSYWLCLLVVGPFWYLAASVFLYGIYFDARHNVFPVIGLIFFATALLCGATSKMRPVLRVGVAAAAAGLAAAVFLPPSLATSRQYEMASELVRAVRADIEAETSDLAPASTVLLLNVPQAPDPPYYFGWGLLSSLKRPFTATDLANVSQVVSHAERKLNQRKDPIPERFDYVYTFGVRWQRPPPFVWGRVQRRADRWLVLALRRMLGLDEVESASIDAGSLGSEGVAPP